jgi:hypothetical protein
MKPLHVTCGGRGMYVLCQFMAMVFLEFGKKIKSHSSYHLFIWLPSLYLVCCKDCSKPISNSHHSHYKLKRKDFHWFKCKGREDHNFKSSLHLVLTCCCVSFSCWMIYVLPNETALNRLLPTTTMLELGILASIGKLPTNVCVKMVFQPLQS